MIAVYERVSSTTQRTESQHRDLEQWATGKEARWFTDNYTGTTMERPGWEHLWTACCDGTINTIVVWRLDRLGRTARGLITLRDELLARKINLISLRDAIELSTASGRLMFSVIASVAEYETEVRRERQTAGIAAAKERGGVFLGRKPGRVNRRTKAMQDTIYAMYDAGRPVTEIARHTQISRPTVDRVLALRGTT